MSLRFLFILYFYYCIRKPCAPLSRVSRPHPRAKLSSKHHFGGSPMRGIEKDPSVLGQCKRAALSAQLVASAKRYYAASDDSRWWRPSLQLGSAGMQCFMQVLGQGPLQQQRSEIRGKQMRCDWRRSHSEQATVSAIERDSAGWILEYDLDGLPR